MIHREKSPDQLNLNYEGWAEYITAFMHDQQCVDYLKNYPEVALGATNLARLQEYGVSLERAEPDNSKGAVPVLPCLRKPEDILGEPLVYTIRSERSAVVKHSASDEIAYEPSEPDVLRIQTHDPYTTYHVRIDNPALLLETDFEQLKNERTGTGRRSIKGLYWRLTLLDGIYRFMPAEFGKQNKRLETVALNIATLARRCDVPLANERKWLPHRRPDGL